MHMLCKDKISGKYSLVHKWTKKVQKYPYIEILKVQALREIARCARCGKARITIVNLSSASIDKSVFREEKWEDM